MLSAGYYTRIYKYINVNQHSSTPSLAIIYKIQWQFWIRTWIFDILICLTFVCIQFFNCFFSKLLYLLIFNDIGGRKMNRIIKYWNQILFLFIRFKSFRIWKGTRPNMQLINPITKLNYARNIFMFREKNWMQFLFILSHPLFWGNNEGEFDRYFSMYKSAGRKFSPISPGRCLLYVLYIYYIESTVCGWNRKLYIQ